MASSGYTAITFVADEQPTTAKWNLIGSNDASFNNGNGFEDGIIVARHYAAASANEDVWRNGVAFSAYLNANQTVTGSTDALVSINTERYDIGSDFNTGTYRFVAPYDGIYHFDGQVSGVSTTRIRPILTINGTSTQLGSDVLGNTNTAQVSADFKLNAGDYVELRAYIQGSTTLYGASGIMATSFNGHLVTRV